MQMNNITTTVQLTILIDYLKLFFSLKFTVFLMAMRLFISLETISTLFSRTSSIYILYFIYIHLLINLFIKSTNQPTNQPCTRPLNKLVECALSTAFHKLSVGEYSFPNSFNTCLLLSPNLISNQEQ